MFKKFINSIPHKSNTKAFIILDAFSEIWTYNIATPTNAILIILSELSIYVIPNPNDVNGQLTFMHTQYKLNILDTLPTCEWRISNKELPMQLKLL